LVTAWRFADWPTYHFVVLGEGDDRWRRAIAFVFSMTRGFAAFHHGDAGIGRAEIDTDDFGHGTHTPEIDDWRDSWGLGRLLRPAR